MANHYILLQNSDDKVLEEADSTRFRKTGVPPVLKSEKGIRWLDLVIVNPVQGADQIKEGPTVHITDTTYTRTWTVRDKTDDEKSSELSHRANNVFETDSFGVLVKLLNSGTFVPDSDYTSAQIKKMIVENL